jgi:hypothetical protein
MNSWAKGIGVILILLAGMASTGCALFIAAGAGAGVGVGTAEYIRGELKQIYSAPIEKVWNASLGAATELKMITTEKSIDNLDQKRVIKGKTAEAKDFQISLQALSKDVTMVKVRIGLFGEETFSKKVQESIGKKLKK